MLRPQYAVAWAAFFNFIAFAVFGLHVAQTIGTGIIHPEVIDAQVIFAALIGAIVWNLVTWALGMPSSSSHALIGGLLGAGVAKAGISVAAWSGLSKTLLAIVLSPFVGFLLALALMAIVSWASGAVDTVRGRSRIPDFAIRIRLAVYARSRRQRCTEDNGHHRCAVVLAGLPRRRVQRAVLGGAVVSGGDGASGH